MGARGLVRLNQVDFQGAYLRITSLFSITFRKYLVCLLFSTIFRVRSRDPQDLPFVFNKIAASFGYFQVTLFLHKSAPGAREREP